MDLSIRNIEKKFDEFTVLNAISLDIRSGELIALLGPSGSGKTTLLRLIAGLDQPSSGKIFFSDEDASIKTVQERHIGFVFQNYALFRHMTVEENIGFGLKVRQRAKRLRKSDIQKRVSELLALVQLSGLEKRFPHQLSGGQRQRVALARAMAIKPKLLLLDEPFGALDAKVRRDLRRWLRQIHDETGHTTLFVTHDQQEAFELADRVVVMNRGSLEQVGTPDEIYDAPKSAFVYDFIGDSNHIPVEVRAGKILFENKVLTLDGSELPEGYGTIHFRPADTLILDNSTDALSGYVQFNRRYGASRILDLDVGNGHHLIEIVIPHENKLPSSTHISFKPDQWKFYPRLIN